ncbi:MAG: c-type cytochrome [Candidatus Acidiferrales bacterium]
MKAFWTRLILLLAVPAFMLVAGFVWLISTGLSARTEPGALEMRIARIAQRLAIPSSIAKLTNPMQASPELLVDARRHFADHCASCHANDGSGKTEMGQKMYPRVPDMRSAETQSLTDGELYYIIENGVRFTGMPAWGTGGREDHDTWHLILFIRQLPHLTPEDMSDMKEHNPQSPAEMKEQQLENNFLNEQPEQHNSSNHHR